jgi:hypothetical protein
MKSDATGFHRTRLSKQHAAYALASALALFSWGCTPRITELNLSQELVDTLPKDVALEFLKSLQPSTLPVPSCIFTPDGVRRWLAGRGLLLSGKRPYAALRANHVVLEGVGLYAESKWCIINISANARARGHTYDQLYKKVLTALLSLGVNVPQYARGTIKPRQGD